MKTLALLAGCAIAAIAAPASAATITYTLDGNFSATDGSTTLAGPLTFTGTADTDNFLTTNLFGTAVNYVTLDSFSVSYAGTSYDLLSLVAPFTIEFGAASSGGTGAIGFGNAALGIGAVFSSPALAGYDGTTAIGPVAVNFEGLLSAIPLPPLPVTLSGTDVTFSASIAAVPEPAAWALMIGGFGLVGASIRRARVRQVGYAAA